MEKLNACPLCKSESYRLAFSAVDYLLTGETFDIDYCLNCGSKFTNPRPSEGEISTYYESDEYVSHSGTSRGLINKLFKIVRKYTLYQKSSFIRSLAPKGNLLDIGCGSGEFLYKMKKYKFEVSGVEPNFLARKTATELYNVNVIGEKDIDYLEKSSYNIITLWHVLEHVYKLEERLLQIKQLSITDGFIVIAVPNFDSFDAKHYSKYWAALDVPRHLYHFNRSTLISLLHQHGFSFYKIKPMVFDAFYISLLSEKNKHGKSNFIKGLYFGFLSNFSAIFTKNYSSNVFVFRKE
jgi:2-polyprenyl-3-methyl-5-hydroxy-6-metoxy-1,4-benzoquinol methylase